MNAESVTGWLLAVGVPSEVVSVGAEADNAWCLLREELPPDPETGEAGIAWEVFWREQGNRYDWARFTNEQVACHYLFGRLAWAQVARGAVGVLPDRDDRDDKETEAKPEPSDESAEDTGRTSIPAGA